MSLKIDGRTDEITTTFGGIMTLIFILTCIGYFWIQIRSMWERADSVFVTSTFYRDDIALEPNLDYYDDPEAYDELNEGSEHQ